MYVRLGIQRQIRKKERDSYMGDTKMAKYVIIAALTHGVEHVILYFH